MQVWLFLGNATLILAALVTTALVFTFGVFSRWEKTQLGRQFMLTKLSLAVILDYGAIVILFSDRAQTYTSFTPIRVFIYGAIALVMLRWLIIVIRTQRDVRRHRHPVWDAPDTPPPVRREQ